MPCIQKRCQPSIHTEGVQMFLIKYTRSLFVRQKLNFLPKIHTCTPLYNIYMYNLGRKYTADCVGYISSSSNNGWNMRMSGMNDWIKQEILFWTKQEILFWIKQEIFFYLELISPVSDSLSGTWSQSKTEKVNQSSEQNKTSNRCPKQLKAVTVQHEKYIFNDAISPFSHKLHFHFHQLQFSPVSNFHLFLLSSTYISSFHQFLFSFSSTFDWGLPSFHFSSVSPQLYFLPVFPQLNFSPVSLQLNFSPVSPQFNFSPVSPHFNFFTCMSSAQLFTCFSSPSLPVLGTGCPPPLAGVINRSQ